MANGGSWDPVMKGREQQGGRGVKGVDLMAVVDI